MAAGVNGVCREIHLALPDPALDMYRLHQLVWEAVKQKTPPRVRPRFLYARVSPRLAVIRSTYFDRGRATRWSEGKLRATLVTSKTGLHDRRMYGLTGEDALHKVRASMLSHGIEVLDAQIERQYELVGMKSKESRWIVLPVSDVVLTARALNSAKADLAWVNGIGRGKRFGCGMIRHA